MSNLLAEVMSEIVKSQGKSQAYMMMRMAQVANPPGDPMRLFHEWLYENEGHTKKAITDLGLELPTEGPGLGNRIRELVTPVLVKRYQEQE